MNEPRPCPVCRDAHLRIFFRMDDVPVYCNVLWPTADAARAAERGDIHLGFCTSCGLVYNVAFDPDLISYSPDYENSLHFSPRFQRYAEDLASRLVADHALRGKDVLEIGSGKGDFLAMLCSRGARRGIGFDASYDPEQSPLPPDLDITIVRDGFSAASADHRVDLICCRHVLEHIPDPRGFLVEVKAVAERKPGTAVFFEVPDVMYTLRDMGIWDIIYEHCTYYSSASMATLFRATGFQVDRVSSVYGSQFLCLEASINGSVDGAQAVTEELEDAARLVDAFSAHYANKVQHWEQELGRLVANDRRVAIWGAGSKGVSFLNTVKAAAQVRAVIDVNPRKQARFVAGTGHQVVAPDALRDTKVDDVLVMNPLYRQEIAGQLDAMDLRAKLHLV